LMQHIEVDVPFDRFQVNLMSNGKERRPSEHHGHQNRKPMPSQCNQSIRE
jgi:Ni,Fe-hydrogenase III component G